MRGVVVSRASAEQQEGGNVFEAVVAENAAHLRYVGRRVASAQDAEDIVQQAYNRALDRLDQLRHPERIQGWFFEILRHTLSDHLAKRARERARHEAFVAGTDVEEAELSPVTQAQSGPSCRCGEVFLKELPDGLEEVVRRLDLQDQSTEEVAQALGITPNNVRVRAHRAHHKMREALHACCKGERYEDFLDCQCS